MEKVKIFADRNFKIGQVEDTMFSSFIEHLGRSVYTGIYEKGHKTADASGFRKDVLELIKELNVSVVRYPGGNFVSGYNWLDGIGPAGKRPVRLDYAWRTTETNEFGTDEFMAWSKAAGLAPMMAVNLGTGSIQDAGYLVEYCNHPGGTYYSDLRKQHGAKEPYKVKYWCLGNEMDGGWQTGHMNAEDYSKKAREAAKIMKWADRDIKIIACGSSSDAMDTFPEWDRTVLENLYQDIDYLSCHQYYFLEDKPEDFYASFLRMDNFISSLKATCDYVKTKRRMPKTMMLSFDEWNVWYMNSYKLPDWDRAPRLLEDIYSLEDAVVFGGVMNTLINNCDRVKVACLAQLVNVIAPILTEPGGAAIRQTTFYPFKYVSNNARGTALKAITECGRFTSRYGSANIVSESIVHDGKNNAVSVFLCNYSDKAADVDLEIRGFENLKAAEFYCMSGNDIKLKNTIERPGAVKPVSKDLPAVKNGKCNIKIPAFSWNMVKFSV